MAFIKGSFGNVSLVQGAIKYAAEKTQLEEKVVEQVIHNYFSVIRRLMIERIVNSILLFGWGNMTKRKTIQEKAIDQIELENQRRLKNLKDELR